VAAGVGVATDVVLLAGAKSGTGVGRGVGAGAIVLVTPIGDSGRLAMRVAEAWLVSVIWATPVELEIVVALLLAAPSSSTISPSPSVTGSPSVVVTIPEPETEATVTLPSGSVAADAFTKVTPDVTGLKLPFGVTTTTAAVSALVPVA
jgi:hypothetical protein